MADDAVLQEDETTQQQDQIPAAEATPVTPAEPVDADDRALADAEAELAAEEDAAKEAAASGDTEAEVTATETLAAPVAAKPAPVVPIDRLNQETTKRRSAEEEAAYWRGKAEALEAATKAGGTPPAAAAEPAKTPADQIRDLRAAEVKDAEVYNAGDIDVVEWTKRRAAIEDQIADIRAQAAIHVATERATSPQTSEWLAAETAKIEAEFPVLTHVSQDELQPLSEIAKAEMKRDGRVFNGRSRESILELRQRTAELADHNFAHRVAAAAAPASPATPAKPSAAKPTSPAPTAAQRAAKARLADRMPPDITRAGSAASATGIDETRIEQMNSTEVDGLSDAELEALERKFF